MRGGLFAFEGPDGVGKTAVVRGVGQRMQGLGFPVRTLSFPGQATGSLGALVYRLHHDPRAVGVERITPEALQALHVAAHLDAIDRLVAPALLSDCIVLLDRFWWSTWVYGRAMWASEGTLDLLVGAERAHWGQRWPTAVVLLERPSPFGAGAASNEWERHVDLYRELAASYVDSCPVFRVANVAPLHEIVCNVTDTLLELLERRSHAT
jgi:dTMP kinase